MNRDVGGARDPGIVVHPAGHPGGFRVNESARDATTRIIRAVNRTGVTASSQPVFISGVAATFPFGFADGEEFSETAHERFPMHERILR